MSGYVLPAIPKRVVDFTTLASGSSEELILADRVSVPFWRELTLLVQVYSHSLASAPGTIVVVAYPQSWTTEDPGLQFVDLTNSWSVTLSSSTPNPGFVTTAVPTTGNACIGHMTRIVARGTRTSGSAAINATISVEFSTKDA